MAAYRRVYDSRHLQADCQEPGLTPEPYALQSTMGNLYLFYPAIRARPWLCAVTVGLPGDCPGQSLCAGTAATVKLPRSSAYLYLRTRVCRVV